MYHIKNRFLLLRHIGWEFLFSFVIAFSFFFFIFLINNILLLAENILSKNISFFDVIRLLTYVLPSVVSLSFPFASLLGVLMTMSNFVTHREILAMQSLGISAMRVFVPISILGLLLSLFSFTMNNYFLPLGTVKFNQLYQELLLSNPELILEPYSVRQYQENIIITGDVSQRKVNNLVIIEPNPDEISRRIIAASEASLLEDNESGAGGIISLQLENVFSMGIDKDRSDRYEYLFSDAMIYNILLQDISVAVRNPGPREMDSGSLKERIDEKAASENLEKEKRAREYAIHQFDLQNAYIASAGTLQSARQSVGALYSRFAQISANIKQAQIFVPSITLQIYRLEYNRKFSLPLGCFFFVLFCFPIGLMLKRGSRMSGFGVGLFASFIYWSLLIGGQTIGISRPTLSPVFLMWLPNILMVIVGTIFLIKKMLQ